MRLERYNLVANIWILSILLYLFRSIAEPLKHLFIASFGILLLSYVYFSFKNLRKYVIIRFLFATKEFLIVGLFLVLGILLSTSTETLSIKSLINFLGIAVFFLIYLEYRNQIKMIQLFRGWIILAILIGILGLLKWSSVIIDLEIRWFNIFYKHGTSLVSDYNIYASYFIISIIIYLFGLHSNSASNRIIVNQAVLLLFITNVALTGSRRGLVILMLLMAVGVYLLIKKRKEKHNIFYRNLVSLNVIFLALLIIIVSLIPLRSRVVYNPSSKAKIAKTVYRYSTLFKPGITYNLLFEKLWPKAGEYKHDRTDWDKYATYNNLIRGEIRNRYQDHKSEYWLDLDKERDEENLFYNGDFKYGRKFWAIIAPDSINHEIISTEYGNALRVTRFNGEGYWPLIYNGREILYYKDVTYLFKFKYRVVRGSGVPFKIGWWVNEGQGHMNNLPYITKDLGNGWFEYTASYRFNKNHQNLPTFMNSQQENTIVDFADIELTCNESLNRPKYLDQVIYLSGTNLLYNSNFESGLEFWSSDTPDTIIQELIDTRYGKAIRISRKKGIGYWPLIYQGREIFYHKNLTYYFRFKFRVIEGEEAPFNIGWWANNEEPNPYNLHKDIYPLTDEWFECIASYTFQQDHYGDIKTFMNSQKGFTTIDFTDIELICNDSLNRAMYADQKIELIDTLEKLRLNQELATIEGMMLSNRIDRWKYAFELWIRYNVSSKLIGGGFDYLEKFGQKFYPKEDRKDYPHNPIISSFLYSGLIGGFFYIYFLVLSFWYYWKYRKHHLLFFLLYLITFAFVFISSDSHFNVPIFAMLSLVPFTTKYVVKEKEQKNPI